MAKKEHIPETQATQFLRKQGVVFSEHPYAYEEKGGTKVSARELNVDEHAARISLTGVDMATAPVRVALMRDRWISIETAVFKPIVSIPLIGRMEFERGLTL